MIVLVVAVAATEPLAAQFEVSGADDEREFHAVVSSSAWSRLVS